MVALCWLAKCFESIEIGLSRSLISQFTVFFDTLKLILLKHTLLFRRMETLILFLGMSMTLHAVINVTSPSGGITVSLELEKANLLYQIQYRNQPVLNTSLLRWSFDTDTLGVNVKKLSVLKQGKKREVGEGDEMHSVADARYTKRRIRGEETDGHIYFIDVRAYDDGVAFRVTTHFDNIVAIQDLTTFELPDSTICWSQPDIVCYEGRYDKIKAGEFTVGQRYGGLATFDYDGDYYACLTEGNLHDFGGLSLRTITKNSYQAELCGRTLRKGDIDTPWRVIMIGSLHDLVNCSIVRDVSAPVSPIFHENSSWIVPGDCAWSWLAGYGVTVEKMKKFIDWAAELNVPDNVSDEGWSHGDGGGGAGWNKGKELVEYGKSTGGKTR